MTVLLGIDFETSGLNPETDRITEFGAILWTTDGDVQLDLFSSLVYHDKLELSEEITNLTGITTEMIRSIYTKPIGYCIQTLVGMMHSCDYCVAHNAEFDRNFFFHELVRLGFYDDNERRRLQNIPWIDTVTDVPYRTKGSRSLGYLCADHGFLNPFPHRALYDVASMQKLVAQYDFNQILKWHTSNTVELAAVGLPFDRKDEARNLGFYWNAQAKVWTKKMKQVVYEQIEFEIPFEVKVRTIPYQWEKNTHAAS